MCKMLSTDKAHQRFSAQSFTWGLVTEAPPAYQSPRLPGGKQVLSMSHMVQAQRAPLLGSENGWDPPHTHVSRNQPPAGLARPFQGLRSQACCVNSLLHNSDVLFKNNIFALVWFLVIPVC